MNVVVLNDSRNKKNRQNPKTSQNQKLAKIQKLDKISLFTNQFAQVLEDVANNKTTTKGVPNTTNTKKDTTFQKERDFSETVIPNYSIERVDRVSGAFEQGELHVIIDKNSSKESQHQVLAFL